MRGLFSLRNQGRAPIIFKAPGWAKELPEEASTQDRDVRGANTSTEQQTHYQLQDEQPRWAFSAPWLCYSY